MLGICVVEGGGVAHPVHVCGAYLGTSVGVCGG